MTMKMVGCGDVGRVTSWINSLSSTTPYQSTSSYFRIGVDARAVSLPLMYVRPLSTLIPPSAYESVNHVRAQFNPSVRN